MDEFLAEYGSVLRGLVRNEKAQINMLSMLAEDNRAFAEGIVRLIEQHILTCPPPAKLPALYLVDSIIKNVGDPYKSKFSERLPEVFGAVWETTLQEKRASLSRLYGTWTGVLPAPVLARVQERMASPIGAATAQQRQQPPRAAQPQPAPVPQVLQVQPQQHQQQQQQPILQMPTHMTFTVPGQLPGQQLHVLQQQPQLLGPQQFMGLHQPQQPTFMQLAGGLMVPVLPQQILQPIPLQQHPQLQQQQPMLVQHNTPQHIMQAAPVTLPPVSPAHPGWVPPQQQQQQLVAAGGAGPMLRRSPGSPAVPTQLDAMRGPPPPPAARSSAGQQQQQGRKSGSPMPTSGQLTSDALSQLLSNLAGTGVLAKGGDGAAEDAAKVQKVKDFQPAFLKVLWAGAGRGVIAAVSAAAGLRRSSTVQCQRGSRAQGRVEGPAASPACRTCTASLALLRCMLSCKPCPVCTLLQAWHAVLKRACMLRCQCPSHLLHACLRIAQLTLCVGWDGRKGCSQHGQHSEQTAAGHGVTSVCTA